MPTQSIDEVMFQVLEDWEIEALSQQDQLNESPGQPAEEQMQLIEE